MSGTGNFIQCLKMQKTVLNRWFIEDDDVTCLEISVTSAGYLRCRVSLSDPVNHQYYRVWARRNRQRFIYIQKNYNGPHCQRRFIRYLKNSILPYAHLYSEIVIMKFNTPDLNHPISITRDDAILMSLKRYHSDNVREWIASFTEDTLAPKDNIPDNIPNNTPKINVLPITPPDYLNNVDDTDD